MLCAVDSFSAAISRTAENAGLFISVRSAAPRAPSDQYCANRLKAAICRSGIPVRRKRLLRDALVQPHKQLQHVEKKQRPHVQKALRQNAIVTCRVYAKRRSNPVYSTGLLFPFVGAFHYRSFVHFSAQSFRITIKLSADRCSWLCLAAQRENAFNLAVRPPFQYASMSRVSSLGTCQRLP